MALKTKKFSILVILFSLSCLSAADEANAERTTRKWSIQPSAGVRQAAFNHFQQPWVLSVTYDARVYHRASAAMSLGVMLSYSKLYNDPVSTATFKIGRERADAYWKTSCLGFLGKIYLNSEADFEPYLEFGTGLSSWEVCAVTTDRPQVVRNSDGTETDFRATELFLMTGVGAESFIHPRLCINYNIELFYLTGLGADFDGETNDSRSRGFVNLHVGVGFYFGSPRKSLWEKWRDEEERREERKTPPQFVTREPAGGESDDTLRQTEHDFYADSDFDGVRDEIDLCPDTPIEAAEHVDDTGCPTDGDSDGVPDYMDECFGTPVDMPVDPIGCPLDEDADGIPDAADKCSGTPEGYEVDRYGCADKERLFARRVLRFNYPPGGSDLGDRAVIYLDSLTQLLTDFEGVKIRIFGYTDNIGDEQANLRLSQKRADKIKGYLVLRGVDKGRIEAIGKGETDFIASNANRYGREENRRIEVQFDY